MLVCTTADLNSLQDVMWDSDIIPPAEYTGEQPLALPKLNLQFLTFYDYLLRYTHYHYHYCYYYYQLTTHPT